MSERIVRVLPDVPAVDRSFDYRLPEDMSPGVRVGTIVRVGLSGRRVRGWVLDDHVAEPAVRDLSPVTKVSGAGPPDDVIDLCRWAARRWAGRLATMLRLASPQRNVSLDRPGPRRGPPPSPGAPTAPTPADLGLGPVGVDPVEVLEVAPTTDPTGILVELAQRGQLLVVTPHAAGPAALVRRLRGAGLDAVSWPDGWSAAAAGAHVVGGRSVVFAPAPRLGAVVVLDEHDEAHQSESSPTWHAREVAVERARRRGVPCLLVSPSPSLEALLAQDPAAASAWRAPPTLPLAPPSEGPSLPRPARRVHVAERRSGWAPTTVVDRRGEDGSRGGLYTSVAVEAARGVARAGGRVVFVLNRTGRARLMACRSCGSMLRCASCGSAVHQGDDRMLACGRCGAVRPPVCTECGSAAAAVLRPGVSRAREELEALVREPVASLTASDDPPPDAVRVVIGTSAALHRVDRSDLVVVLDLDQELLAPRYRAAEEGLALLVLANRQLGGRSRGGRLVVQTRLPDHPVLAAALRADPSPVRDEEAPRRRVLRMPPAASVVEVGGPGAPEFLDRVGPVPGVVVQGPVEDRWLLRTDDLDPLCDRMAAVRRPSARLSLRVDPLRLG